MTRMFVAALTGLLVCSASHAQEPHEKWLKYLAGQWTGTSSTFEPAVTNWSLAPGHHALFGTGYAKDTGETAEITGWEPDKKRLVHTWYSKKNSAYSRIAYRIVSDSALEGKDSGVMPDGRPYAGEITVHRVNDDKFTFKYSGEYTDDKKGKYEGKGEAVRIKPEGKAAVKAMRAWGDFLADGVWTTTDRQGKKYEDRWQWALNRSFLQLTRKIDGKDELVSLGGPEPGTGRWVVTGFDNQGGVYQGINEIGKDGELLFLGSGQGNDGPWRMKLRAIKVTQDTVRVVVEENVAGGKKQASEEQTWTRKK